MLCAHRCVIVKRTQLCDGEAHDGSLFAVVKSGGRVSCVLNGKCYWSRSQFWFFIIRTFWVVQVPYANAHTHSVPCNKHSPIMAYTHLPLPILPTVMPGASTSWECSPHWHRFLQDPTWSLRQSVGQEMQAMKISTCKLWYYTVYLHKSMPITSAVLWSGQVLQIVAMTETTHTRTHDQTHTHTHQIM